MGIFSRLFQRGQDGNPTDAASGNDGDDAVAGAQHDELDEPEITMTPAAPEPAAPAAPASAPPTPAFAAPAAGLTPAFASASSAPVEPQRSIWDWPGPQRDPRRSSPSSSPPISGSGSSGLPLPGLPPATTAPAPSAPSAPNAPNASDAPERPRAALPSLPKTPPAEPGPRPEPSKERDATMVLSPPPAPAATPTPAPSGKGKGKAAPSAAAPSAPVAPPAAPSAAAPTATASAAPTAAAPATPPAVPARAKTTSASPPPTPTRGATPLPPLTATAPAPAAGRPARRAHSDSVGAAFDQAIEPSGAAPGVDGVSTVEDLAEVRRVFNEVAAIHVAQVRDVMLELRYGEAQPSWIESTQPALRSLRTMAAQMDLADLCGALDEFCVAVDAAVSGRAKIDDAGKAQLMKRYERLIELIPQAFELDAERDRREPIIVEALLYQIDGVERRTIEKLFAVGLNRLDALMRATADEIAIVAGLRGELADAIVEQFKSYRAGASSALAAPDPLAERRALGDLLIMLSVQHDEYSHAATKWSDDARTRKQEARKQREQTFQRIKVALARLGERDQLVRLEKLPYGERIATLDRYLSAAVPARAQPGKP